MISSLLQRLQIHEKNDEIAALLRCLSNLWGTFEIALINWKINIKAICSEKCIISSNTTATLREPVVNK